MFVDGIFRSPAAMFVDGIYEVTCSHVCLLRAYVRDTLLVAYEYPSSPAASLVFPRASAYHLFYFMFGMCVSPPVSFLLSPLLLALRLSVFLLSDPPVQGKREAGKMPAPPIYTHMYIAHEHS